MNQKQEVGAGSQEKDTGSDKAIAYGLWFFLGLLGAHRFWWGKWKTGLVQLVSTLGGLLAIIVGGGGSLISLGVKNGEAAASFASAALLGLGMLMVALLWLVLDMILIALWEPRGSQSKV